MNEMSKVERVIAADETVQEAPARKKRKITVKKPGKRSILMWSIPLLIAAVGLFLWLTSGRTVETDNAYVKQDVTAISTQVNGPVAAVYVRENQHVNKGDILYRIDPAPFEAALHAAQAQLAAARLQTNELVAQAQGTGADIRGEEANLSIARRALDRQAALMRRGFTTKADYDDALNEVTKAENQLADARSRANIASTAIAPNGNQPAIAAALAAVERRGSTWSTRSFAHPPVGSSPSRTACSWGRARSPASPCCRSSATSRRGSKRISRKAILQKWRSDSRPTSNSMLIPTLS